MLFQYYELRFPRLTKVFRSSERLWTECLTRRELAELARKSVGRDPAVKDLDDWCKSLWGKATSPSIRCPEKRKLSEDVWMEKLTATERKRVKVRLHNKENEVTASRPELRALSNNVLGNATNIDISSPVSVISRPARSEASVSLAGDAILLLSSSLPLPAPPSPRASHVTFHPQLPLDSSKQKSEATADHVACSAPRLRCDTLPTPPCVPIRPQIADRSMPTTFWPVLNLLNRCLVWLARPVGSDRPTWCPPTKTFVPLGNQVHGLDAFLSGCGWSTSGIASNPASSPGAWVECGVILVDDEAGLAKAIELLASNDELPRPTLRTRKPIYVIILRTILQVAPHANHDTRDLRQLSSYIML
jgi:DNA ligase 4